MVRSTPLVAFDAATSQPPGEAALIYAGGPNSPVAVERMAKRGELFAVMHGVRGDNIGSRLLIELHRHYYRRGEHERATVALHNSIQEAGKVPAAQPSPPDAATDLLAAVICEGRLHLVNASACRAYLARNDRLYLLTHDYGDRRGASSRIPPPAQQGQPDMYRPLRLQQGDRVVLCSAGLYQRLAPEAMLTALFQSHPASRLVDSVSPTKNGDTATAVVAIIPPSTATLMGVSYGQFAVWICLAVIALAFSLTLLLRLL